MAKSNPRDTYRLVAERIRADLLNAGSGSDTCLPSEAALGKAHGVSRTTVRRALRLLKEERVIESIPGVGWRPSSGTAMGQSAASPLYRQIVVDLTRAISGGELALNSLAPSEGALSKKYAVSRSTVRRALAELEGAGVLETRQGRGRFVRNLPQPTPTRVVED